MALVNVARADDVPAGQMKLFKVDGKEVLVVNYEGKHYAIGGRCSHMNGELAKGRLEGRLVTCPRHGSRFDVTTGKVVGNVSTLVKFATGNVATDLKTYPVTVQDGSVFVEI